MRQHQVLLELVVEANLVLNYFQRKRSRNKTGGLRSKMRQESGNSEYRCLLRMRGGKKDVVGFICRVDVGCRLFVVRCNKPEMGLIFKG